MKDKRAFFEQLNRIHGQSIDHYKELVGDYDFTRYVMKCFPFELTEHQATATFSVRVPQTIAELPEFLFDTPIRRTALEDYLLRSFCEQADSFASYDASGVARQSIIVNAPTQKILPRNAVQVTKEYVELRVLIDLPVRELLSDEGLLYVVDGHRAQDIFYEEMMEIIGSSLLYCNMDHPQVETFVHAMDNADRLRQHLNATGQVAFLAEGSLVERDGLSDEPNYVSVRPLQIEESLHEEVEIAHGDALKGTSIPAGLTVIVGDDQSGRIDLAEAIAQGIYNHIPGDGREQCVSVSDLVQITAEPGRSIQNIDMSVFVEGDQSVRTFSTETATAFESQVAATLEALEVGARVLLYDEQSSDPAFLTSDSRLQAFVGDKKEVSLAARARQMVDELGISIVVSGSNLIAEYLPIADRVLRVKDFTLSDITAEVKEAGIESVAKASTVEMSGMLSRSRWIMPSSIDSSIGQEDVHIEYDEAGYILFGRYGVDMSALTQVASIEQMNAIGQSLYYAKLRYMDEGYSIGEILDLIDRDVSNEGLNVLARDFSGTLARPRRFELVAMLNRLPSFRVSHITQ